MRVCTLVLTAFALLTASPPATAQTSPTPIRRWSSVAEVSAGHFSWVTTEQTIVTLRASLERDLTRHWGLRFELGRRQPDSVTLRFSQPYYLRATGSTKPVQVLSHGQHQRQFTADCSTLASARRPLGRAGRIALLVGLTWEMEQDRTSISIPVGTADNYTFQDQSFTRAHSRPLAAIGLEYAFPIAAGGSLVVSGRAAKEIRVDNPGDTAAGGGVGWRWTW